MESFMLSLLHLFNGKYIKVCDAHNDSVRFELDACGFDFDFGKIW